MYRTFTTTVGMLTIARILNITGWWLSLPLWKIWVHQLGWWNSPYMETKQMFQTTNQLWIIPIYGSFVGMIFYGKWTSSSSMGHLWVRTGSNWNITGIIMDSTAYDIPMDPSTWGGTGVWFGGLSTFSDSVWIHRVCHLWVITGYNWDSIGLYSLFELVY